MLAEAQLLQEEINESSMVGILLYFQEAACPSIADLAFRSAPKWNGAVTRPTRKRQKETPWEHGAPWSVEASG